MHIDVSHHPSWDKFINGDNFSPLDELECIESKIGDNYFPSPKNVLRFMKLDLSILRYVIVGMEPYPSSFECDGEIIPEATGRSFEVASLKGKSWSDKFKQSSLRNIVKTLYFNKTNEKVGLEELRNFIKNGEFPISNPSIWFDNVEKQGVCFLNATLTVEPYNVASHTKYWDRFMEETIKYMVNENPHLKWVLWGQPAQKRVLPFIDKENAICSMHPRLVGFIDENCFAKMNDIDWIC